MHLSIRLKLVLFVIVLLFFGFLVFRLFHLAPSVSIVSPLGSKSGGLLSQYSFENLRQRSYEANPIIIDKILKKGINFTSHLFFYESDGKKISGLLNIPTAPLPTDGFPVVVLLRGYVDQEIYYTGLGTQKAGEYFAGQGYLTLAPDFIGYGSSDPQLSADILEDRFEKPVEVLNLLASIPSLRANGCERGNLCVNSDRIFLWGHSNGGQIAISVLEISKKQYPTVLWAPVTKGFPDSVLGYMKVMDDQGLKVKTRIDKFLQDYEAENYSIDNYFENLQAPLQIHQGTGDEYIEEKWTDNFVERLKKIGKSVEYYKYPGADHNLSGSAWQTAVSRSLDFYHQF